MLSVNMKYPQKNVYLIMCYIFVKSFLYIIHINEKN